MPEPDPFQALCVVVDEACIVEVHSDVDLFVAPDLARRLAEAAASGRDVVVDLCDAPFLDSAGLRELIRGHADVIRDGRRFVVACRHGGPVLRLLKLSGLTRVFDVAPSRDAALELLRDES